MMIRRIDANGNGVLEPNELQGRAQYMIQRVMPGANLSRPIAVDALRKAFEAARAGGGPPPPPDGGKSRRDGRPSSASYDNSSEPLVPGFGNEFNTCPVFGFGKDATDRLPAVEVSDADERQAQIMLRHLDKDRDRVISREEADRQPAMYNLFKSDADRNGKIDIEELAQYYARERLVREARRNEFNARRAAGQSASPGGPGNGGSGPSNNSSNGDAGEAASRPVYRIRTVEERLPAGLPTWFRDRDADGDGQVMMAEFATDWTDELAGEFSRLDRNGDAIITPEECLAPATTAVAAPSSPATEQAAVPAQPSAAPGSQAANAAAAPPVAQNISPAYLQYAKGVVSKYDKDGNGMLAAGEWAAMSKSPAAADTNGDGQVSVTEYAGWIARQ